MAEDSAPARIAVSNNAFQIATEGSDPATDAPGTVDEADEIT